MQKLKRSGPLKRVGWLLDSLPSLVSGLPQRLVPSRPCLTMLACLAIFLMALSLLSGCQAAAARPTLPQQADARPMPVLKGKTYRDALLHIPELQEWGTSCEADKAYLRQVLGDE